MKKNVLVVVDVQRDFYSPQGALYVPGAEKKIPAVAEALNDFTWNIFTLDFHPNNHCSFKAQGGMWPPHCIGYSEGAGLADRLAAAVDGSRAHYYLKGRDPRHEEYGAFNGLDEKSASIFEEAEEIVVCGIAAEYCVLETLKNLVLRFGNSGKKIKVFLAGVACFGDGKVLEDFMAANGIEEYVR